MLVRDTEIPDDSLPAVQQPGSEPLPRAEFDFAAIYEEHLPVMVGVAAGRFGIPEADAETLAHDVFVDFILKAERVTEVRAWLIASIFNASRYYSRVRARSEALPETLADKADPELARVMDMWPDRLAGREAFSCTTARCQLVLRLRYFEQYTIPEIAEELGITKRYATKLVGECLRQAHRRYTKKGRGEQ